MPQYRDVLRRLREAIDDFEMSGVKLDPLRELCDELEQKADQITAVEENLEAVQNQIIDPVNTEVAKGRRAANAGFVIGLLGFVAAIFSAVYPSLKSDPNTPRFEAIQDSVSGLSRSSSETYASLKRMMQRVLAETGVAPFPAETLRAATDGEIYVGDGRPIEILSDGENTVSIQPTQVLRLTPVGSDPELKITVGDFRVFLNSRLVDDDALDDVISVASVWEPSGISYMRYRGTVRVAEEDVITILDIHKFAIVRMESRETLGRPLADEQTGIWLMPLRDRTPTSDSPEN